MEDNLTKKQKGFADDYLTHGNATQAVKDNYNVTTDGSARAIGSENLTKPNIIQYFKKCASDVSKNMYYLALNAEKQSDQITAGKDVLDRAGYKPKEVIEQYTEIDLSKEDRDLLSKLETKLND